MSNRMRKTRSKTAHSRSHDALENPATAVNENGVRHYKHRASAQTGTYRGRQVLDVEKELAKKQKKQAAKEESSGSDA